MRESQDPGKDAEHVIGEPDVLQQPPQSPEHGPNVDGPVPEQQPDVSVPDLDFSGTAGDLFDHDDDDEQPPTESVPHSSSSHWE